jgi:hypothetical protein
MLPHSQPQLTLRSWIICHAVLHYVRLAPLLHFFPLSVQLKRSPDNWDYNTNRKFMMTHETVFQYPAWGFHSINRSVLYKRDTVGFRGDTAYGASLSWCRYCTVRYRSGSLGLANIHFCLTTWKTVKFTEIFYWAWHVWHISFYNFCCKYPPPPPPLINI